MVSLHDTHLTYRATVQCSCCWLIDMVRNIEAKKKNRIQPQIKYNIRYMRRMQRERQTTNTSKRRECVNWRCLPDLCNWNNCYICLSKLDLEFIQIESFEWLAHMNVKWRCALCFGGLMMCVRKFDIDIEASQPNTTKSIVTVLFCWISLRYNRCHACLNFHLSSRYPTTNSKYTLFFSSPFNWNIPICIHAIFPFLVWKESYKSEKKTHDINNNMNIWYDDNFNYGGTADYLRKLTPHIILCMYAKYQHI